MNAKIQHNFQYHPTTGATMDVHAAVRAKAKELAQFIDDVLPADAGREKATAIAHVESAMMWACAGILRYAGTAAIPGTDLRPKATEETKENKS